MEVVGIERREVKSCEKEEKNREKKSKPKPRGPGHTPQRRLSWSTKPLASCTLSGTSKTNWDYWFEPKSGLLV